MSQGNKKAQEMTSTLSTESILITGESNWIQMKTVIWFVLFIWLNQTNQLDQMNQIKPDQQKGLGTSY